MHINPHTLHNVRILRRMTASLTGALIALTAHAMYQDTAAMIVSMTKDADATHAAPSTETSDDAARIRDFAEQLKQERAGL
jgi:hypothetical protein